MTTGPGVRLLTFEETVSWFRRQQDPPLPLPRQRAGGRHHWRHDDHPTRGLPLMSFGPEQDEPTAADPTVAPDPPAATAGEQDHEDPWAFAGEDCGPPPSSPEDREGVA